MPVIELADRGPRFLSAAERDVPATDVSNAPVFKRRVTLEIDRVALSAALGAIARQTGLKFVLSATPQTVQDTRVSVHADNITVGGALHEILVDTDLDVQLSRGGFLTLIPRARGSVRTRAQGAARIQGRVTDAKTAQGLSGATVTVQATNYRGRTDETGRYTIAGVVAGSYAITARLLGYAPITKSVVVQGDSTTQVIFALEQTAATLEQVVTTGAGPQRRVELGNAIATINADSVVQTAPVTNLTDVISGRAPNVDVLQTSGLVGTGPAIRIRGRGSVTVPNDPIYIVDGVRIDGSPGGELDAVGNTGVSHPTPSRLNDLDPDEIETIEVLRGPSAATEYGTDAANGVVVITTKRGHAGAPRWSATAEEGVSTMPVHFPNNYYSWGHTTGATPSATKCPLTPFTIFGPPGTPGSSTQQCVVDSVTQWQPLDHYETSLFGTGYRGHYALQVSGGGTQAQYFLAGGLTDDIGAIQMPNTEVARLERERGEQLPRDQLRPNALNDASLRGRATAALGSSTDASVNVAYVRTTQRTPDQNRLLGGGLLSPGIRDSVSGYTGPFGLSFPYTPAAIFANTGSEDVSRLTGGLSGAWRPTAWLSGRATVGVDDASKTNQALTLPGQGYGVCSDVACDRFGPIGYRSVGLYRTDLYSVDVGATAAVFLARSLSSRTTVGLQYNDRRTHGSAIAVTGLALGNPTLNGASVYNQVEQRDEAATLGSYVEETMGIADRLFLVGAVRVDAGSGFGTAYKSAAYPKASASWVVLPEGGRTSLRLRAAYGQSGVQPPPGSALQLYAPSQTYFPTGNLPTAILSTIGSPGLKPERTREVEGGFDLGIFGDRVHAEATAYSKLSHDALINVPLEGSLDGATQLVNLGSVSNRGVELSLTARLLNAHMVQWDVTVSGSDNENRLVTLGPGVAPIDQTSFFESPYKQAAGFPLYGLWAYRIHYRDLNHDGLIEPSEVTIDSLASYIGPSLPPRELAVNTAVALFGGRVRVGGQLDYHGGQYLTNTYARFADIYQTTRATNDPHASLASQARAVAADDDALFRVNAGYVEPASFTRLRELSLTYVAPRRLAAAIRARSLSVTLAGRNLALWTKYTGSDPEVSTVQGGNQVTSLGSVPTTVVNPDIVGDFGSVPQMRYWTLKVNVGL